MLNNTVLVPPLSLVLLPQNCSNVDLSHAWHFKLSSFRSFSRFVSSRDPQVADLYGFLLDHYLLLLHVSSFLMVLLFIHALLAFLPFLLKLFVIFKTQKCSRLLLLVLIISYKFPSRWWWSITLHMMVWCQKTWLWTATALLWVCLSLSFAPSL